MYAKKLMVVFLMTALVIAAVPSLTATVCWTVMVYLDGDNNLESFAIEDLNEMEVVGSTEKVNIVVQFDRHAAYDNSNGNWTSTKRFFITKDSNGFDSTIVSTELSDEGELNMGDPTTLSNFITWAQNDYPADHYLLVLWDHGSGWKGVKSPVKAVCVDETDGDQLDMNEVRAALDTVTNSGDFPLDIVGFDACFMAMVEVDYDILPYAHYRVGSEEYEPGDGWDYYKLLAYLVGHPYASPRAVSVEIVDTYMNFYGSAGYETQSAAHLNPTSHVVDTLDVFALHLAGALNDYRTEIQTARAKVEFFSDMDFIDLYHFAHLVFTYVPNAGIKKDAYELKKAVNEAIIAEGHGFMNRDAHGLSVYFPSTGVNYQSSYENTVELPGDTFWDEFLKQYYSANFPLDAVMAAVPEVAHAGEIVSVTMTVTNKDDHTISAVTPSVLTVVPTGTAHAVYVSGPTPASADLVAGDSVTFTWQYQVYPGGMGGAVIFSGNAYGTDSVSMETVFSPFVSTIVKVPGAGQNPENNQDDNQQMQPVADNRLQAAEQALEALQLQLTNAQNEGKDTTPCEELFELVEVYLQRAQENYEKGNYIAANYWALQATKALDETEECLRNL
jgi:hypothetical protein